MNIQLGDAVIYNGKRYYITGGPVNTSQGPMYDISEVPPTKRVPENELRPASDARDLK
jgi:hypothetical protein